jgi:hypothetical protein
MTLKPAKAHVEYLLAGVAFFVSVTTLFVYIYQARMMREQQHVSVWPYVEWHYSNVDDYHISVRNKGVGPALIRKVEMRVDGQVVANNKAFVTAVLGPDWTLHYVNSTLEGCVMAAGEEITLFKIPDLKEGREFEKKKEAHDFQLTILYCSIYGDCWKVVGGKVERQPAVDLGLH